MRYSKSSKGSLHEILKQILPAAQAAGSFCIEPGLSGGVWRVDTAERRLVARPALSPALPGVSLHRQCRALKRAGQGIGPEVLGLRGGWLITTWLEGEIDCALPALPKLTRLLYDLHHRPLMGWRIGLPSLLIHYWLRASPARRTILWKHCLERLLARGEPSPLHLAPLHMDVHSGNIIHQQAGLRLIDWEYAGDGDIALELAAVAVTDDTQRRELVDAYSQWGVLDAQRLWHQVQRWRPWVMLLMASWYECRWQQTGDAQFITLAAAEWTALRAVI